MMDVVLALGLFAMAVMAHIQFCRREKSKALHAKAFILIALFFLLIHMIITVWIDHRNFLDKHSLLGVPFELSSAMILILLIPVYLCFYVLTQLTSPSKKILSALSSQGPLTHAQIIVALEQENFINTRLQDLLVSGCVRAHHQSYALTNSGERIIWIIKAMQMITGRDMGG